MAEPFGIDISDVLDVMAARAKVREIARLKGLGITEQARIALAASSTADLLGLGTTRRGQIIIEDLEEGNRIGVRVICIAPPDAQRAFTPKETDITKMLVDDLTIQGLPSDEISVTLVQWAA